MIPDAGSARDNPRAVAGFLPPRVSLSSAPVDAMPGRNHGPRSCLRSTHRDGKGHSERRLTGPPPGATTPSPRTGDTTSRGLGLRGEGSSPTQPQKISDDWAPCRPLDPATRYQRIIIRHNLSVSPSHSTSIEWSRGKIMVWNSPKAASIKGVRYFALNSRRNPTMGQPPISQVSRPGTTDSSVVCGNELPHSGSDSRMPALMMNTALICKGGWQLL